MPEERDTPWGVVPVYRVARRMPAWGLVATLGVFVVDHTLFWAVPVVASAVASITTATGGLVQHALAGNAMRMVLLAVLWFGVIGLRPRDIGLVRAQLAAGVRVLVGGWLAIQAVRTVAALVAGGGLAWSPEIDVHGGRWLAGALAAQVFGTALGEEPVFRGMLFPQLFLRVRGDERQRVVRAAVAAAIVFSLDHIPMLLHQEWGVWFPAGLVALALAGCFFAAIYLRTGSLFVAMAVHALFNVPGDLVASPLDGHALAVVLGLFCILTRWPASAPSRS